MPSSNTHVLIDMDGSESDSGLGSSDSRRIRRWRSLTSHGGSIQDASHRLNSVVSSLTPLFTHVNRVNPRLEPIAETNQRREAQPFFSYFPPRTQSLGSLPVDPFNNVRRFDSPHPNWQQPDAPAHPTPDTSERTERHNFNPPTSPAADQDRSDEEDEENEDHLHVNYSDLLSLLPKLFKFAPVFLILFTKFVIDNIFCIVSFITLIITFYHTNNVVKSECHVITDRNKRKLLLALLCSVCCIMSVGYIEGYYLKYLGLPALMPMNYRPNGLWEMLWAVTVTDCFLKLITIDLKILLILMPWKILPYKKRGKILCFMETTSQLYRAVVPLQPWICFLLDSYEGYQKIIAVCFTSAYIVSKGFDISRRAIFLRKSFDQLLKSTEIGVLPNKAQLEAAGKFCPICHEDYITPVLLNCSHVFCEMCVSVWLNKVQTCPLCRAQVITSSTWRNGATSQYIQLY